MSRRAVAGFLAAFAAFGARAADDTIRVGLEALPASFGVPYRTAQIPSIYTLAAMFDTLTRMGAGGELRPSLATSWKSSDGVSWVFTLRDDVRFSNGVPFDANAVKVAVDYMTSEEALQKEGLVREIPVMRGARVIDARTVEITLVEPDPQFPRSASAFPVAEPGQWQRLGREGFGKEPVGTGPFQLVRWEPNKAVFRAFEGSWRKPKAAALEVVALPDRTARTQAVISGQINVAISLGPEEVREIAAAGGKALTPPASQVHGIAFMMIREGKKIDAPWTDVRVRKAISMAIDRKVIIDVLLDGHGVIANQPAIAAAFGFNPDVKNLPYDPAAAKKLLAEAGYPNGFSFSMAVSPGTAAANTEIAQRVAADLKQIGITMEIRAYQPQQFLQTLSRSAFETDAFSTLWPSDPSLDALRPLRIQSCLRREPFYCDETIMPKIRAALVELDEAKALSLRRELMAWYADQEPGLFLYGGTYFVGTAANVSGFSKVNGVIPYDEIALTAP